jgi:hypothetical protein
MTNEQYIRQTGPETSQHWFRRAAVGFVCAAALGCAESNLKSPGLDSLGSPGLSWAEKSEEQRMGFMAGWVTPRTHQMFAEHDSSFKDGFSCDTCHGENAEALDYEMPSPDLYALPRENTLQESIEYDPEMTQFMQNTLTPQITAMFNQGEGRRAKVDCFSCHPVDD